MLLCSTAIGEVRPAVLVESTPVSSVLAGSSAEIWHVRKSEAHRWAVGRITAFVLLYPKSGTTQRSASLPTRFATAAYSTITTSL